jgi:hypothetical protein
VTPIRCRSSEATGERPQVAPRGYDASHVPGGATRDDRKRSEMATIQVISAS